MAVADVLSEYEVAPTWCEATRALDRIRELGAPEDLELGELYDEAATGLAEEGEYEEAVRAQRAAIDMGCRYPELGRQMVGSLEARLVELASGRVQRPLVAALDVDELVGYAEERRLDPDSGAARAGYAAELSRAGKALRWPPGRNQPCWFESGRKYKRCCGA